MIGSAAIASLVLILVFLPAQQVPTPRPAEPVDAATAIVEAFAIAPILPILPIPHLL
jgi:hypothetical protein